MGMSGCGDMESGLRGWMGGYFGYPVCVTAGVSVSDTGWCLQVYMCESVSV